MAIEDSVVLARCLATVPDPVRALEAFTAERNPRTSAITRDSWKFGRIGQLEGRLTCWFRDAALGVFAKIAGSKGFLKNATFDVGPLPRK